MYYKIYIKNFNSEYGYYFNPPCDYYDPKNNEVYCDRYKFMLGIKYSFPIEEGVKSEIGFMTYKYDGMPIFFRDFRSRKNKIIKNFEIKNGRIYEFNFSLNENWKNETIKNVNNLIHLNVNVLSLDEFKKGNKIKTLGILERKDNNKTLFEMNQFEITDEEREKVKNYEKLANPTL